MNTQWLSRLGVDAVAYVGGVYETANRPRIVPPHRPCGVDGEWYFVGHSLFNSSVRLYIAPGRVPSATVISIVPGYACQCVPSGILVSVAVVVLPAAGLSP